MNLERRRLGCLVPTVIAPTKENERIWALSSLQTSLPKFWAACRGYRFLVSIGEFSAPRWTREQSAAAYVAASIVHFKRRCCYGAQRGFHVWHGWDAEMASATGEPSIRLGQAPVRKVLQAGLLRRAAVR